MPFTIPHICVNWGERGVILEGEVPPLIFNIPYFKINTKQLVIGITIHFSFKSSSKNSFTFSLI
jgi:hypothetical protein